MKLLFLLLFIGPMSHGYFADHSTKYLSSKDIFAVWKQKFPDGFMNIAQSDINCTQLTQTNRNFIGDVDPTLGKPYQTEPSPVFMSWYAQCARKIIARNIELKPVSSQSKNYSDLTLMERTKILTGIITHLVGPDEVLASYGTYRSAIDLATEMDAILLKSSIDMNAAIIKANLLVMTKKEFLTY